MLGNVEHGVFIPTHFAPRNIRKGYFLIRELGESDKVPAVMAITEDLSKTLKKLPSWHIVDLKELGIFRGEEVRKDIAYNSHPETENLMFGILSDYLEDRASF